MDRKTRLLDSYRGLLKEVYVIFILRIINALGCSPDTSIWVDQREL
ncbi:MAG: hypothetical protein ACYCVD_12120 [Desulfitobacteriaceae bacterium]